MNKIYGFFDQKSSWIQGLFLILLFLSGLTIIPSLFIGLGFVLYHTSNVNNMPLHFLQLNLFVSQISGFLLPALCFSYLYHTLKPFNFIKADRLPLTQDLCYIFLLSFLFLPTVSFFAGLNKLISIPDCMESFRIWSQNIEAQNAALLQRLMASTDFFPILINLVLLAVTPAICEEFFFRGALQPFLQKICKSGPWAIFITAFIFSAFHGEFTGFIPRFLLGLYLGYLVYFPQSMWSSILAHFIHNTISIIMQYVYIAQDLPVNHDEQLTTSSYILGITCSVLIVLICYYWRKKSPLRR